MKAKRWIFSHNTENIGGILLTLIEEAIFSAK